MSLALELLDNAILAHAAAEVAKATTTLSAKVTSQAAEITALKSTVAARNATIATLETENAALKAEIERLRNGTTPPPDEGSEEPETPREPGAGILFDVSYLRSRPLDGTPYKRIRSAADGPAPKVDLGDLNSQGDTWVVRAAMVLAVMWSVTLFDRLWAHLKSIVNTRWARTLEAARGLAGYIVAMDILMQLRPDLDVTWFVDFLIMALQKKLPGHSGFDSILESAFNQLNNWSGAARSTVITASLFILRYGDAEQKQLAKAWLDKAANVYRVFLGDLPESALGYKLNFDETKWYPEWPPKDVTGILKRGTIIKGLLLGTETPIDIRASGGVPTELIRTQDDRPNDTPYYPPPDKDRGYLWEWLNVALPGAVALHRAGLVDINAGDYALQRALDFLYGRGENAENKMANGRTWTFPADGDDAWIIWWMNAIAKPAIPYPTTSDSSPGKAGIGDGEWLFGEAD